MLRPPLDIRWWVVHAAGSSVLDNIREALGLSEEQMWLSRAALRLFGNTSSTSIGIQGKILMEGGAPEAGDYGLVLSVGPGMTGGATLLHWACEKETHERVPEGTCGHLAPWFALPAAWASVLLGMALVDAWSWTILLALGVAASLMAAAHGWNSFHDYVITGLDREGPTGHSAEKLYTGGQNLIRAGRVTPTGVLANTLVWLALAAVLAILLTPTTPLVWIPFIIIMVCAPWYSFAKFAWHPELPLSLGFAPAAVWLGMAVSGSVHWWTGFLAAIPFFLMFGVIAEHVDQALDAETDWPKGARSLGMLTARLHLPLELVLAVMAMAVYAAQGVLVVQGILAHWTILSAMAAPLFAACVTFFGAGRQRLAILWGLGGITVYQVLVVVGQVIG